MRAFIQISLDETLEDEIYDRLMEMPEIEDVNILFGEWDMIVKLELENPEALAAFVMKYIRSLEGVKLTSTMIVAR